MKDECQRNQWSTERIFSIETDEKKAVRSVTLHVVDRNVSARTQVLCYLVTKIVMLVGNEFDSPTKELKLIVQDEKSSWGSQMKRHMINFVNNNIPVIAILNLELFTI